MAWFRKRHDPISDRARELNREIADLEAKLKELDSRGPQEPSQPRLRSTALPHQQAVISYAQNAPAAAPGAPAQATHEPIFEELSQDLLKPRPEGTTTPDHYNELGVRKYDLPELMRRVRAYFRGPSTTNPKLVSYLAAGGIQGLRPLRIEKRVARNRFIALVIVLFVILLGLITALVHHR
jgi:hypothetical protein